MADQVRQPVAIRVMRPYSSEEAFIENEVETLTRTSIVLVGAQPRPQGVVLRFEVVLETGVSLLRGEGRVVGFKQNAFGDLPGLTLRFTRLDTRSKALVDRAALIRDEKTRVALEVAGSQAPPPPNVAPRSVRPPPAASIPRDLTPPPYPVAASSERVSISSARPPAPPPFVPPPEPSEPILVASTGEIDVSAVQKKVREMSEVADRESVLGRLRDRRKALSEARVNEIFALKRERN
ncbi:MAG: hypothetical protein ACRELY_06555 [Polyangiaceae bacterium]